jgi:hypothetical protein
MQLETFEGLYLTFRDLSNGFIVAEILVRYFPKELNIYNFHNGHKSEQKVSNWKLI